ncbi:hypothetical protein JUN65_04355 [Gluconacetobacter azotocaptans]|uniref:hypothetical protein n=1 Tax=Gluconacetobacter azotocaptans TaxID=142834 RepID=UPI00195D6571|nr:hypothetical protein [Gluconacetobacter azotocaptans]MBM9400814.1 hypothetical protein [Gluconacetobacter azotocaptans]
MSDLHFKEGLVGKLARWMKSIEPKRGWSDNFQIAAIIAIVGAFCTVCRAQWSVEVPIAAFLFWSTLAGATYGLDRGGPEIVGPMVRGLAVGGATAALLHTMLPDLAGPQQWAAMAGTMMIISMYVFFFASFFASITREFLLVTEAQWAVGVRRRAKMRTVWRIHAGAEKLEGQPDGIIALLYAAKMAVFVLSFVAVLVIAHFLHVPIAQAIRARLGL